MEKIVLVQTDHIRLPFHIGIYLNSSSDYKKPVEIYYISNIAIPKEVFKKIKESYPNVHLKEHNRNLKYNRIPQLFLSFLLFPFCLGLLLRPIKSLYTSSWTLTQIYHSIFDSASRNNKFSSLRLNSFDKLKALIGVSSGLYDAIKILSIRPQYVLLGHTVYAARATMAILRKFNIKLFAECMYCIQPVYSRFDVSPLDTRYSITSLPKLTKNELNKFIYNRTLGSGSIMDPVDSFNDNNKKQINFNLSTLNKKNKSILFLHVFRDSSFTCIDRSSIFIDYVDWVKFTINCIKNSNRLWDFAIHPSAKKWGEDSSIILKEIFHSCNLRSIPNNIRLISSPGSSQRALEEYDKVVTYKGTVQYEAVLNGIKPITLSESELSYNMPEYVYLAKSKEEYKKLLLIENLDTRHNNESVKEFVCLLLAERELRSSYGKHLQSTSQKEGLTLEAFSKNLVYCKDNLDKLPFIYK